MHYLENLSFHTRLKLTSIIDRVVQEFLDFRKRFCIPIHIMLHYRKLLIGLISFDIFDFIIFFNKLTNITLRFPKPRSSISFYWYLKWIWEFWNLVEIFKFGRNFEIRSDSDFLRLTFTCWSFIFINFIFINLSYSSKKSSSSIVSSPKKFSLEPSLSIFEESGVIVEFECPGVILWFDWFSIESIGLID